MADKRKQILDFIVEDIGTADGPAEVDQSSDLFRDHILDSLSLMRLIAFIESSFGIPVDGGDVVPENFVTVDAIAGFVGSK